jgi:RNA exonuclease 4
MSTLESLAAGTSVDEFRPFSPAHRALLRAMRWVLFWREARTIVHKVKGHRGQTSNDRADQLAALGANSDIVATVPGYGGKRTTSNAPTNQLPNVASSHGFFPGSLRYDLTRFLEGVAAEGSGAISNDLHAFTRKETAEGCRSNDRFASHRGPIRIPTPIDDSFEVTGALALDCEMVGSGPKGEKSILAQVSVVNESGNVVYSSFVAPTKAVTDYRTHVSGITPDNIDDAPSFSFVQSEVRELIRGKIIVGHALENDFDVLKLRHPPGLVRDTAHWRPFLRAGRFSKRLRHLARDHCGLIIQGGSHDPAEDARAAMYLYLKFRDNWEGRVDVMRKGRDSRGRLTHY